ncbi:MAG: MarR family winged helix-turn-helix transcriptional regulator [Acidimicrobiales bacterium]
MSPSPTRASRVTESVGFRLSRVARALRAQWRDQLADLGVEPPEAAALRVVAAQPGAALRQLARILGSDPMSTKRCVDALEARGLVASTRQGEGRPRALRVTPAGTDLVGEIERRAAAREDSVASALGPAAVAQLRRALDQLEASLTSETKG